MGESAALKEEDNETAADEGDEEAEKEDRRKAEAEKQKAYEAEKLEKRDEEDEKKAAWKAQEQNKAIESDNVDNLKALFSNYDPEKQKSIDMDLSKKICLGLPCISPVINC